jgi:hypothetical protein
VGGYYGGCSETAMKKALVENGPLAVSFEVFKNYILFCQCAGVSVSDPTLVLKCILKNGRMGSDNILYCTVLRQIFIK